MITVSCTDVGKQYQYKWILQGFNHRFHAGGKYVIAGKNGSGKTTLLKLLSSYLTPSKGRISWQKDHEDLDLEKVYLHTSLTGPYVELPEEFTFPELIAFVRRFKPFPGDLSAEEILGLSGLENSAKKPVKTFSSGMKQKAKLASTIIPEAGLLLLDEPCTNLDADARSWYREMLEKFGRDKTVIVASNHFPEEYPANYTLLTL